MRNRHIWNLFLAIGLSGCANHKSIYRHSHLHPSGQFEIIDAKQRAIISAPVTEYIYKLKRDDTGKPIPKTDGTSGWEYERDEKGNYIPIKSSRYYKFCSEPPPDVFSAYATSSTAEVNKEKGVGFGGVFGLSSSEVAASLEHTQTVNMLRESMFRTCERYMSGALSAAQMNIQTARDQRMMVATLAIEQLTGVVKSKPTILTAEAASAIAGNAKELIEKHETAQKARQTAEATVEAAEKKQADADKAYNDLNKKSPETAERGACDKAIEPKEGDGTLPAEPTKENCEELKSDVTTANSEVTKAEKALADAKASEKIIAEVLSKPYGMSTSSKTAGSGDEGRDGFSESHIAAVAKSIERIVDNTFDDNSEINFACIEELKKSSETPIATSCKEFFKSMIDQNIAKAVNRTQQLQAETAAYFQLMGDTPEMAEQRVVRARQAASNIRSTDWRSCALNKVEQLVSDKALQSGGYVENDKLMLTKFLNTMTQWPLETNNPAVDASIRICGGS